MGWFSIISQVLGLGDAVAKITGQIADARVQLAKAAGDVEHTHAEERVKSLEAQRDVLIEESRHTKINVIARLGFAAPIIIVLWKILVWDQTLHLGSTNALGQDVWNLIYIVAGFYFVQSISQIIKR